MHAVWSSSSKMEGCSRERAVGPSNPGAGSPSQLWAVALLQQLPQTVHGGPPLRLPGGEGDSIAGCALPLWHVTRTLHVITNHWYLYRRGPRVGNRVY